MRGSADLRRRTAERAAVVQDSVVTAKHQRSGINLILVARSLHPIASGDFQR